MNLEGIVLFVHILGVLALFGGLVMFQNTGRRLRSVTQWHEARSWLGLLRQAPGMFIGGSILLLASGLYLARMQSSFTTPWVVVGIVSVLVFALLGALVVSRALVRLERVASEREGPIPGEMRVLFTAPSLWSPIFAMNGAALGVLWLMTNQPGWTISIVVPLTLGVIGAAIGRALHRPGLAGAEHGAPALGGGFAHRTRAH